MASEPMHAFDFTMPATYGQSESSRARSWFEVDVDLSKRLNQNLDRTNGY